MDTKEREARRRLLHRLDRQRTLLAAAIVGALSGTVAVGFRMLVERSERLGSGLAHTLAARGAIGYVGIVLFGALVGGFAGLLVDKVSPEAGGSGIPQAKAAILGLRPIRAWRLVLVKILGGCAALTAGMSLGREGPTIHLGAAMGELFGRFAKAPMRSRRTLIAAGGGAGLAAAFNAPLAGFLFVLEELRREMSPITYATSLVGSVLAVGVARFLLGQASSFTLAAPPPLPLTNLPAVLLVGALTGLVGVAFNKSLMSASGLRMRRKWPRWACAAAVGAVTSLLFVLWTNVTGGGHGLAEGLLRGEWSSAAIGVVLALLVGKFAATVAAYSTGVPGGIFAPLLVVGGLVGLLVGLVLAPFPAVAVAPSVLATVGMAAILAASVRAPLTGVVLIVEMTRQYDLLYDLLVAAFAAYAVAEALHDVPIYEALLERDLHGASPRGEHAGQVLEAFVEIGSRLDGAPIRALRLPENVTVAMVDRDGRTLAPRGGTVLRAGDHLTAVVGAEGPQENALALIEAARAP